MTSLLLGLAFAVAPASTALAISPGCAAVNSGSLDYSGSSPILPHLGVVLGQFYPGDELVMTYTSNSPKAGVVLDLILTSVSVNTVTTGAAGTTHSLTATVGALLPIGAQAGITDLTALLNPRTVVMTVTCTPAPTPTTLAVTASINPVVFGQPTALTATVAALDGTPDGDVIFTIDGVAQPAVALSNGEATLNISALSVGTHVVSASYAGNGSFTAASNTLPGGLTVDKASTTTSLVSSSASSAFGADVTFTATTSATAPGAGTPDGSMIFTIDGVDQAPVAMIEGSATFTTSALSVGSHVVAARYVGSGSHHASSGTLDGGHTVTSIPTNTTLSGPGAIVFGSAAAITATVTAANGTPSGSVIFTVDGEAQAPVALNDGSATIVLEGLAVGTHTVSAAYAGAAAYDASSGNLAGDLVVTKAPSSLMVSSSTNPSVSGQEITFTATASSAVGTPTGSVVFTIDGIEQNPVALAGGVATISLPALPVGSHTVSASYEGNADLLSSSASLPGGQTVARAATTLSLESDTASAAFGATVSFTAHVAALAPGAGTPTGNVVFSIDGVDQPAVALNGGAASITRSDLGVGAHVITALYVGDTDFEPASGTLPGDQTVVAAETATAISFLPANPQFGDTATLTATVSAVNVIPTGLVIFTVNGTDQPPVGMVDGVAQFVLPDLAVGSYTLGARFAGSTDYAASAATDATMTVAAAATTTSVGADPASVRLGEPVTISATVSALHGTPAGNVAFYADGALLGTAPLVNGTASLEASALTTGNHAISASYAGSTDHAASNGNLATAVEVTEGTTTLTLAAAPQPASYGETVNLTATVSAIVGTPSGSIIFTVDGVDQPAATLSNGTATIALPLLAPGSHAVTASYGGSSDHLAVSANLAGGIVVDKAETGTVLTVPLASEFGAAVAATASVTSTAGTPSGSVTFYVDGAAAGSAVLVNGVAMLALPLLDAGDHEITAEYAGDLNFAASIAAGVDIEVGPAAVTVSVSTSAPNVVAGEPVTITAGVMSANGPATGSVTISIGATDHIVNLQNGVATLTTDLAPGTYAVTASFAGSPEFAPGSASLAPDLVVDPAPADINVSANLPRSVAGEAYTGSFSAYGGVAPYTYAVSGGHLPPGIALDTETGVISGTPSAAGTYFWEITATGAAGAPGIYQAELNVLTPTTITLPADLSDATYGVSFEESVAATGGTQPIGYAVTAGSLPPGLALDAATGDISGTPSQLGTATFTITATDANGFVGTGSYSMTVGAPTISISGTFEDAVVGTAFSSGVTVTGGTPPYMFSIDGTLPPGLALDHQTGVVSGTPSQAGTFDFAILVADVDGFGARLDVSMDVEPRPDVVISPMAFPVIAVALTAEPNGFYAIGQTIVVTARIDAHGATVNNIAISSTIGFSCPRTSLNAGETMNCTGLYLVTDADLTAGQTDIAVTVTADGVATVGAHITLLSLATTISDTFQILSGNFVADRARMLSVAIPLPDILARRSQGTRAGTVQASHHENGQVLSFTSSLAEWRSWAAAQAADGLAQRMLDEPLPVNIWIDAQYSIHAVAHENARWGHLGTIAVGADYLVADNILAGLMVQGDWAAEASADGSVDGRGYLAGPYVSIALNDNLSFSATMLYGRSSNTTVAPMLGDTFSGDFETSRFYTKAALSGYFEVDKLTVRPNATFVLTSESTGDYKVSDANGVSVTVPGGEHLRYRLTSGAAAEYAISLDNGSTLTPMIGLDIGVTGGMGSDLDSSGSFLGRFTTGLQFATGGLQLGVEFNTELDNGGFSSSTARAMIKGHF